MSEGAWWRKWTGRGLYDESGTSRNYSPPELMILFCWPSATEGMMQEMQHVSQSEQQLQRPVLHLSDMLVDVGSASPRASGRVFNKLLQ